MAIELDNVDLAEITFVRHIFYSDSSSVFLVDIRNHECIMKVHRGRGPPGYFDQWDDGDIHALETTAYNRLKEKGICDRGIVPQYFGEIRSFDPSLCLPHLEDFVDHEFPPSAIFLEYIPNLERISLENATPQRLDNLVAGLQEIHKALVTHNDIAPRNIMVGKDSPDRMIWLDFDTAHTMYEGRLLDFQEEELRSEGNIVKEFRDTVLADVAKGEIDESLLFFVR